VSAPDRSTTSGAAYLDLRKLAADTNRPTDELHQLYALEGFLHRLTLSPHHSSFVLKGGVLLAAYTDRRATRDIDLAGRNLPADSKTIRTTVIDIASIDLDDGLKFNLEHIEVGTIRDDADYPGHRAKITGRIASAVIRFHIDVNIGDPIWPDPQPVELPRLLDPTPLTITGYPPELILAEKIVTALQRGTANTRWRDFVDIAALAATDIDTRTLSEAIARVAEHRETTIEPLTEALDGYANLAQTKWAAWRRKQRLNKTPSRLADLLVEVTAFTDPILDALSQAQR
jgi:hypothetical protein